MALSKIKTMMTEQLVIDFAIAVCKGCGEEHTYKFDPFLRGGEEIHNWIYSGKIAPCACGAGSCDIKLHVALEN